MMLLSRDPSRTIICFQNIIRTGSHQNRSDVPDLSVVYAHCSGKFGTGALALAHPMIRHLYPL